MKKYLSIILSLILALAMVFSLVACGSDDNSSDDDDDDDNKSSSSQSSDDSDDSSDDDSSSEDDDDDKAPIKDNEDDDYRDDDDEQREDHKVSVVGPDMPASRDEEDDYYTSTITSVPTTFNDDLVGDWEGTYYLFDEDDTYSFEVSFTFEANGDYTIDLEEYGVEDGTYEYDGSTLIIDGEEMSFDWDGGYFIMIGDDFEVQIRKV